MARREKGYKEYNDEVQKLEEKLREAKANRKAAEKVEKEKIQGVVYDACCEVFEHDFFGMKKSEVVAYLKEQMGSKPVTAPVAQPVEPKASYNPASDS